jgi:uncharacterized membrane-anchored protein YitT (DUF2179 family)
LLLFGFKKISKNFIYFTLIFVGVYSLVVGFVPESISANMGFNQLDDLTSAILIGIISGFSCAGALFAGGCAGGTGILATYLNVKKGKGIGLYNFIDQTKYPEILWFPQGVYVITSFSSSISTSSISISLSGKDKMVMLNGEVSGHFG